MTPKKLFRTAIVVSSLVYTRSIKTGRKAVISGSDSSHSSLLKNIFTPLESILKMFGQLTASSQFYLYGRSHCTATGYETHKKKYETPDILENESLNLEGNVYMVTGANAGCGREITKYLASKGASLYMVCRNKERAFKARDEIITETKNSKVHVLICDCSLEKDIRTMWNEFSQLEPSKKLNGLVCNAGLLANQKTLTSEGVEITFAVHLLFGTYLLTKLAIPYLLATPESRVVVVSSGGMYNTKFPEWEVATSSGSTVKYDGQFSYAYAKRGQVLLMEKWTDAYPNIKFLSCHPGWTQTEAVDAAYGESKKYLEPLRTPWQGSEGIIYLLVASTDKLVGGGFYLDRETQKKHLAGAFFSEGSFTKNTDAETTKMMQNLELWSSSETRPTREQLLEVEKKVNRKLPLKPTDTVIDIEKFMGDWYVLANIPTYLELGATNCIEHYEWDPVKKLINIRFSYNAAGTHAKSESLMRAQIKNAPTNSFWGLDPQIFGFYAPIKLSYIIPYIADDGTFVIVGVPDRSYLWIMTRKRPAPTPAPVPASVPTTSGGTVSGGAGVTATGATETAATTAAVTTQEVMSTEEHERLLAVTSDIAEDLGFNKSLIQVVKWT